MTVRRYYIFSVTQFLLRFICQFQIYIIPPYKICSNQFFSVQIQFEHIIMGINKVNILRCIQIIEFKCTANINICIITFPFCVNTRHVMTTKSSFTFFPTAIIKLEFLPSVCRLAISICRLPTFYICHGCNRQ